MQRHIDTKGMGILNIPNEIEKAGGKLWISVQAEGNGTSPGNWHSEFTVEEWNDFKNALNDSGMTITDVWIDESTKRSCNMKKAIKSSTESYEDAFRIYPWSDSCWEHSDEDIGLSYAIEVYGNEFNNLDDSELEDMKDTLERYFDDESYVRDWNINNPDYQIEDAYDVISGPEELSVDELATYFDYERYGRDLRLEMNLVWDNKDECWISANDFEPDDENFTFLGNARKPVKSARFIVEDESGVVIGEADTYEEAQTLGGTVIDTQKDSIQSHRKIVKSGKYLESPTDLAVEISEYFDYKMPSRKQVADYMSDKFGTDKNAYSSNDFVDTLDSVMMELPYHCEQEIESSKKISNANFSTNIVKAVLSNRMTQEEAITQICSRNNCNRGFAKNILSRWIDEKYETLLKSDAEIADIQKEFNVDGDLNSWAEDYMPGSGKANTKGGELVRAAQRILNEYYESGNMIGRGFGNETVNPAARYIIEKTDFSGNGEIEDMLNHDVQMDDSEYNSWLKRFETDFTNWLRDKEDLFSTPNDDDIADYIEEDDVEYFLKKFHAEDSFGNQYVFEDKDGEFECTEVIIANKNSYKEGDTFSENDDIASEFDRTEEYGTFEKDGVSYDWEANGSSDENGNYSSWKIVRVTIENQPYEVGDLLDMDDFETLKFYDENGNEITYDDLMRV